MKNVLRLAVLITVLMATGLFAQPDHLLITEFVVTPTAGEFVEIYNPTNSTVDLSNYYITDATFAGGGTFYYNIVIGDGGGGGFNDFNARFPDGATIGPGEFQTIALPGSDAFLGEYGVNPTYEMYEDGTTTDEVPDMRDATEGSIATPDNSSGRPSGLSGGEVLVLYYWDGESDLVKDVDYVLWGDKAEAVSKTGVSIDGPDADSDASTYADDTSIDDQTVVDADNDGDENPHDSGMSAQRRLEVEDLEDWSANGNGMTGHDETGEDTSWKGGIWSINEPPTPGRRALGPKSAADSLTIADINFLRADSIGSDPTNTMEDTPFLGQTISVTGVMLNDAREIFLANRWGAFIADARGGPWSGLSIIQHDTLTAGVEGTLITAAQPGDLIRVTGVLEEFPVGTLPSITQLALITDPVTPIEFLDAGVAVPDPIVLTPGDLGFSSVGGGTAIPNLSERWEGVLARFENVRVTQNDGTIPSNLMVVGNDDGSFVVDDYFNA
ncbi:lamin tail domain-containing protein, partial [bacterium]|nr:lamin tail domain-containing protein [bacterium]